MAFTAASLHRIGGGNPQLHLYTTADTVATATASGYFNSMTNQLRQFDVIMIVGSTGGTATIDLAIVTSATGAATVTTSATEGVVAT